MNQSTEIITMIIGSWIIISSIMWIGHYKITINTFNEFMTTTQILLYILQTIGLVLLVGWAWISIKEHQERLRAAKSYPAHKWFAWYPVKAMLRHTRYPDQHLYRNIGYTWVWLDIIERSTTIYHSNGFQKVVDNYYITIIDNK